MQMNKKLRSVTIALAIFLSAVFIGLYFYTHRPLDHIPSDLGNVNNVTFFALGDQGSGEVAQWEVARAMEKIAEEAKDLDFVVLMGDNFYSNKTLTLDSPEWLSKFENVYSGEYLNATPFYAVLGNHDHGQQDSDDKQENHSQHKYPHAPQHPEVQIQYSTLHQGSNRWRMPNWYYRADFGMADGKPLLRMVFIDTNLEHADLLKEADFIRQQFSDGATQPIWKIVVGHHPVRTYGKHFAETKEMEDVILPALKQSHVDLYLSGHDHNQQVITRDGEPFYFVSGGGGAGTHNIKKLSPDMQFNRTAHGFLRVNVIGKRLNVAIYNKSGTILAAYKIDRGCAQGRSSCLERIQ